MKSFWSSSIERLRARASESRGAALLTVLVAMMIISLMLFEFQYATMVERKLAFNDLNQIQSYYLAKSGVRIGLLRVALYGRILKDPSVKNVSAKLPIKSYLDMIWSLPVPPFPPEGASLGKLLKQDKDAAQKALEQTKIADGQYSHVITTESSKINLNYLVDTRQDKRQPINFQAPCKEVFCLVGTMLYELIDGFIRNSENPYEEFGNIKPEEVVFHIMDWVNPGDESYAGGQKDGYYLKLDPPYRAKRNRFYTVDELRLVEGIDENLFRKLKPHVTVYSYDGRININNASKEVLRTLDPNLTEYDIDEIVKRRDEIGGWPSEQVFVDYISSTLGRQSFRQRYDDPNNYPFTVGSESFLIESVGAVKKSASQVQRVIQVAVSLVRSSKGGQIVPGITSQADCDKDKSRFWDLRFGQCKIKPTNQQECELQTGKWEKISGKDCCTIKNQQVCLEGSGTGGTGASLPPDPNALKILHWSEI